MISEKEIQQICIKELSAMNLGSGCQNFILALESKNYKTASYRLQEIVSLSIAKCIYAVLKESQK